jgi:hypothetical protein
MRNRRITVSVLALLATTACAQTPTESSRQVRPRFDGLGLGSGHMVLPPTQTTAVPDETTATDSTSSGRIGGLGLGSGH